MRKRKYTIVIIIFVLVVFTGIIAVNVEFNKINGNAYDDAVYSNVFDDGRTRSDVYGEMVINRNKGTKLRVYYSSKPFDLRFAVGDKIFYINGSIFKGIKEKINPKADTADKNSAVK